MPSPPSKTTSSTQASVTDAPEIELDRRAQYEPGDILGSRYRLIEVLGEGGMGRVWLAHDETLQIDVAVKLIRRSVATAETAARLLQEARAAARIGHPSIVRILDFGETEYNDPFIVMEVLGGESLRDALDRKGKLAALNAVRTLLPIASALAAAHDKGIVHRDIKPENIVLTSDDRGGVLPKIVDFGIAQLHQGERAVRLTQQGTALGSPGYMSPEQARGRSDIDERSDVWALTVVLYESITGRLPFSGDNYNALLTSIIEDAPQPPTEDDACDAALWRILEVGLAKSREQRWPRVRDLGKALAEWAIARDVDTDVSGGSLVALWLEEAKRPLSDPPPPAGASGRYKRDSLMGGRSSQPTPTGVAAAWANTGARPAADAGGEAESPPQSSGPSSNPLRLQSSSPALPRRSRSGATILVTAALALAAAGMFAVRGKLAGAPSVSPPSGAATSRPAGTAPATAPPAATGSAPAATAAGTAEANASAAIPAIAPSSAAPVDFNACVASQFALEALESKVTIDPGAVCAEADPRRGAAAMKKSVVEASGRGRVSGAMREWALLSWYEMAAFAVIRARCCPSPPPLKLPPAIGTCAPLDQSLDELGAAAAGDVEAAVARVRAASNCAVTSGGAVNYSYKVHPPEGAEAALRKTIERKLHRP